MAAQQQQAWTSGPSGRGTLSILWTCISTLSLCVWTAVHPNIKPSLNARSSYYQRSGMMLLAIVLPEVILSSAWSQYRSARLTCSIINSNTLAEKSTPPVSENRAPLTSSSRPSLEPDRILKDTQEVSESDQTLLANVQAVDDALLRVRSPNSSQATTSRDGRVPHTNQPPSSGITIHSGSKPDTAWTIKQGFFAVMGGYAVKGFAINSNTFATSHKQRLIAVDGLIELARASLLPSLSSQDINERSKADLFAKFLVLSQIIWFGLQVISRLAAGLVVTPLEAHTAIHVACTIVVYLIWLKKPYNVDTPILLKDESIEDVVALFTFSEINNVLYQQRWKEYEVARQRYWRDRHVRNVNNILDHDPPPDPPARIRSDRLIGFYTTEESNGYSVTDLGDELLKNLAPSAKRGLTKLSGPFEDFIGSRQRVFLRDTSENFMIRAVWGSWSTNTGHEWSTDKAFHLLFNLLYGGGHLAAWASSSFPTDIERWVWRGSSIMLAAVPVWGGLWILWWRAVGSKKTIFFPFRNGDFDIAAAPFFFIIMSLYVLARCYFLAESLASLRSLPASAYQTAQWPNVFPHVS